MLWARFSGSWENLVWLAKILSCIFRLLLRNKIFKKKFGNKHLVYIHVWYMIVRKVSCQYEIKIAISWMFIEWFGKSEYSMNIISILSSFLSISWLLALYIMSSFYMKLITIKYLCKYKMISWWKIVINDMYNSFRLSL